MVHRIMKWDMSEQGKDQSFQDHSYTAPPKCYHLPSFKTIRLNQGKHTAVTNTSAFKTIRMKHLLHPIFQDHSFRHQITLALNPGGEPQVFCLDGRGGGRSGQNTRDSPPQQRAVSDLYLCFVAVFSQLFRMVFKMDSCSELCSELKK